MIVNKGNLTITDNSVAKNGTISFKDTGAGDPNFGWGSYTLRNEGTLVVENGTIKHLGEQNPGNGQPNVHMYCAIFQYSGKSTINGGVISTPTYRSARLWSGDMTINDCHGQMLDAGSASGDIGITADYKRYCVKSSSGEITLESRYDADVVANSVSGDVSIHVVEALETYQVAMHSISGECDTYGQTKSESTVPTRTIEANTTSGDILVRFS
jgi:hypothetical protein